MTQTPNAASPHRAGLERRHAMLEARLSELQAHPSTDDMEIKALKREKLRLKETMEGMRH